MKYILYLILTIHCLTGYAQNQYDKDFYLIDNLKLKEYSESDKSLIDSCLKVFHSAQDDTSKIDALTGISEEMVHLDWSRYQQYQYQLIQEVLEKNPSEFMQSRLQNRNALALNNLGYFYRYQSDFSKGIEFYEKSLTISQEIEDTEAIAATLNNIAIIYNIQKNDSNALEYYQRSAKMLEGTDNQAGLASILVNIASIYLKQNNFEKALEYNSRSLAIKEKTGNENDGATNYIMMGNIFVEQGDDSKALEYYNKSIELSKKKGNKYLITNAYRSIAEIFSQQKKWRKAQDYGLKSLLIAQEIGYPETIESSSKLLSLIYEELGQSKKSLAMYKLSIIMRDSINNEANIKVAAQQQAKFEYEKQKAIDDLANEKLILIKQEEKEKQEIISIAIAAGLVLVVIFLLFVFNRLRITKKQRNEIGLQKEIIEETHQEITDSINYAKRLQDAILPASEEVIKHIPNHFIHFNPKSVVSGDFYWFERKGDYSYLAAADCTGHGVPGAMVSVVCSNALNRSVNEFGITEPSKILDKTRELVIETFAKSGEDVKDGMDIALCAFKGNKVIYSGANNPLWIVRQSELLTAEQKAEKSTIINGDMALIEYKADRQPIGLYQKMTAFNEQEIQLHSGDNLYFFTDGFADQFGGEKGKKFKYKAFKKLLMDMTSKPIQEREKLISESFENWKGDLEQVDDVCVIGIRI